MIHPAHQRTLDYIRAFIDEKGYPPTVRELADGTGRSVAGAKNSLDFLVEEGMLSREATKPRALRIIDSVARTETL